MAELKFKIGEEVEITSLEKMGGTLFAQQQKDLIGTTGTITNTDETDMSLPYLLNTGWWVGDINIKLKSI